MTAQQRLQDGIDEADESLSEGLPGPGEGPAPLPDDSILPSEGESRAVAHWLRGPSPAAILGHKDLWLGFRIGPSPWDGYVRIGFAADHNYNAATLDIHQSDFEKLREMVAKIDDNRPDSLRFKHGAQFASTVGRKSVSVMIVEPGAPATKISILGNEMQEVMVARTYNPDVRLGLALLPSAMDSVKHGPLLKAVRRTSQIPISQVAPNLIDATLQEQDGERLKIEKHVAPGQAELILKSPMGAVILNGRLAALNAVSFDFSEWPPLMFVEENVSGSKPSVYQSRLNHFDIRGMLDTIDEEFWSLVSNGRIKIDVPREQRIQILGQVESMFTEAEDMRPKRSSALQMGMDFGMLPAAPPPKPRTAAVQEEGMTL